MRKPLSLQSSLFHVAAALNLYSFATSLIGVFIPLVILRGSHHLWEVPAYYLAYALIKLGLNYPAVRLIQSRGPHFGLGAAFIAGCLQIVAILAFESSHSWLALLAGAAAMALTNAFQWNAMHLYISQAMQEDGKSSSIATISIVGQLSGIVAPLIGGFIGAVFGPVYLLGAALLVSLSALWPLRGMSRIRAQSSAEVIVYNFRGAPAKDIWANFFFNIETSVGVMVWPIYLALFIASFRGIGIISAIAAAVTVVATWIAGRRGDRGQDRAVLAEGVAASSIIDLARILVTSQVWIAIISSAYKASLAYFGNAWTSVYYHHAKRHGLQYIMSMEIACDLAYVALWGVLLVVLLTTSTHVFFIIAFVLAAASAWGCLLITKQGEFKSYLTVN